MTVLELKELIKDLKDETKIFILTDGEFISLPKPDSIELYDYEDHLLSVKVMEELILENIKNEIFELSPNNTRIKEEKLNEIFNSRMDVIKSFDAMVFEI